MLILKRILKDIDKNSETLLIPGTIRSIKFQLGMKRDIDSASYNIRDRKKYFSYHEGDIKDLGDDYRGLTANSPQLREIGKASIGPDIGGGLSVFDLRNRSKGKVTFQNMKRFLYLQSGSLSQIQAPLYQISIEVSERLGHQVDIMRAIQSFRSNKNDSKLESRELVAAPLAVYKGIKSSAGSISVKGSNVKYSSDMICAGILMDMNLGFAPGNSMDPKKSRDASLVLTFKDLRLENDFLDIVDLNALAGSGGEASTSKASSNSNGAAGMEKRR